MSKTSKVRSVESHSIAEPLHGIASYILKSEALTLNGNSIYYARSPNSPIKLDSYFIPVSTTSPKQKMLSDYPEYVNTVLAICDLVIRKSKNNWPRLGRLTKAVTHYWKTILYMRSQGVFSLQAVKQADIQQLCLGYSKNGWAGILKTNETTLKIISEMNKEELCQSVHFYGVSKKEIDTLNANYWQKRLGLRRSVYFDAETKQAFENKAREFDLSFADRWKNRFKDQKAPNQDSMRMFLSLLNNLYFIHSSVDKISFLPFDNPHHSSKKYTRFCGERTSNLSIDIASHILVRAHEWVYNYGPRLVSGLEICRDAYDRIGETDRRNFLRDNNPFEELAEDLGIQTPNVWNSRKHSKIRLDYYQSVDQLIAALQGACAVSIAAFNARRSSEICDVEVGLRPIDLVKDNESDFDLVNFYIEKSYQERHLFYVNKTTSDSIALLIRLQNACTSTTDTSEDIATQSLFNCNLWTIRSGPKTPVPFRFFKADSHTRSLSSFLSFLDDGYREIDIQTHMWRRFFGLVYIYRYDNSNLQSLSQHYRHKDIDKTKTYVTDTDARAFSESIGEKVPNIKQNKVRDILFIHSLLEDDKELADAIDLVKKEKFGETVFAILRAENFSGGFPRLVRKVYLSLSKNLNFSEMQETKKSAFISELLLSRGYTSEPMLHGQCNATTNSYNYSGKCSNKGHLEKEKASAEFCQGCMYHSKSNAFVDNLVEETVILEEDILSSYTPESVRQEAIEARSILLKVIQIHKLSARRNTLLMQSLASKNDNK